MLRSDYERDLASLEDDLAEMANLVEEATRSALDALENQNNELAEKIVEEDDQIDRPAGCAGEQMRRDACHPAADGP